MGEERSHIVINFFVRAIVGMTLIFFVNEFLASKGISVSVGWNLVTFLTSGMMGIPGVALLYGIVFIA
jgi:inhibitor of the pro-sigma K processing machinery